jgi:DNA-binding NarL/FixJ family response regulator
LLADGHPPIRHGFKEELERLGFVKIVGMVGETQEALDLFFRTRPDVVVSSVCLSGDGGFELLRCVKRAVPGCLVILTTREPSRFVEETGFLLGAAAVCPSSTGFARIAGLLHQLAESPGGANQLAPASNPGILDS